ncbi:MAG: hypothetical protein LBS80_04225 [Tannerella sp.]|jgi:hypothetical protein|nr:hypothetical protein [Tannerella sp.]
MAKKKKKAPPLAHGMIKRTSQSDIDKRVGIARKTLQITGYQDLWDTMTKKQKKFLLCRTIQEPLIHAAIPNTVPRQYVRNIRENVFDFMRTRYVGDRDVKLTFMEFFSFGIMFLRLFNSFLKEPGFFNEAQLDIIRRAGDIDDLFRHVIETWPKIAQMLSTTVRKYSQVQFRTYGFVMKLKENEYSIRSSYRLFITLTSCEREIVYFKYKHISRPAYRIFTGDESANNNEIVCIPYQKIFPCSDSDKKLEICIQAHAIHRFKERCDIFDATTRNVILITTLIFFQEVKMGLTDTLIACMIGPVVFGYFPFIIEDDRLFILTFIPLVNDQVYEGKRFMDTFKLRKEELSFLGMDKLSFFQNIDFDQIPALKQALIDCDLYEARDVVEYYKTENNFYDQDKTDFVKSFFDKQIAQIESDDNFFDKQFEEIENNDDF